MCVAEPCVDLGCTIDAASTIGWAKGMLLTGIGKLGTCGGSSGRAGIGKTTLLLLVNPAAGGMAAVSWAAIDKHGPSSEKQKISKFDLCHISVVIASSRVFAKSRSWPAWPRLAMQTICDLRSQARKVYIELVLAPAAGDWTPSCGPSCGCSCCCSLVIRSWLNWPVDTCAGSAECSTLFYKSSQFLLVLFYTSSSSQS